jgi:hypothetical protein
MTLRPLDRFQIFQFMILMHQDFKLALYGASLLQQWRQLSAEDIFHCLCAFLFILLKFHSELSTFSVDLIFACHVVLFVLSRSCECERVLCPLAVLLLTPTSPAQWVRLPRAGKGLEKRLCRLGSNTVLGLAQ